MPRFGRFASGQRVELAEPDFAQQNDADIGTAEIFVLAIGDDALAELRDIVLNADDVGMVFQLFDVDFAAPHRGAQFRDRPMRADCAAPEARDSAPPPRR